MGPGLYHEFPWAPWVSWESRGNGKYYSSVGSGKSVGITWWEWRKWKRSQFPP